MPDINQNKIYSLQIFRGLAALLVLIAHANLIIDNKLFGGGLIIGWCGVDFFFVLSGFIIFYVNYNNIGNPSKFNIYIQKRVIRIYPIYWVYTLIVLLGNTILWSFMGKTFISWLDLNNINIIKVFMLIPTNTTLSEMPILPVAWTLSYEMLFYLAFSLLILLKPKYSYPLLGVWVILIFLNLFGFIEYQSIQLNFLLNSKILEFFLGGIIAYGLRHYSTYRIKKYWSIILTLISIILLGGSWVNAYNNYVFFAHNDVLTFGVPFALLIFSAVFCEPNTEQSFSKIKRVFIYLGDASYSIYLTHFILLLPFSKFKSVDSIYIFFVAVFISLSMGCILYSYVEKLLLRIINDSFLGKYREYKSKKNNLY